MATLELFTTSMLSTEGWPPVTTTGLKDLLMVMDAALAVRVAEKAAVLVGPSALVIRPMATVLDHGPLLAAAVVTSNESVQLAPALRTAPCIWTELAPGLATRVGLPPQLVVALAGLATDRLAPKPSSLTDKLVSCSLDTLLMVIVARATPPGVTAVGEKDLLPVMPVVTFSVAVALAERVPPELVKSAGWMMFWKLPTALPVTWTVTLHVVCWLPSGRAARLAPLSTIWSSPG